MAVSVPVGNTRAESEHLAALFAAEGAGVPQSWQSALDHALRAAELGLPLAQAELAALAGDWRLASAIMAGEKLDPERCRSLRQSIDIAQWLEPPRPRVVSSSPRIATVEGLAPREVCDWIVARAQPRLAQAKVYNPVTGNAGHESVRDNYECYFLRKDSDLVFLALRARIARVTELPAAAMDATAVLHYTVGQKFLPHYDFLDTSHPGYAKEVAENGQRVVTLLLYLNEGYEGGETQFSVLGRRYKGRTGDALFFWNVEPNGAPDRRTAHAGLSPTQGEKWLLTQMIRDRV